MSQILGVIPARLESTRLPRKMLLDATGKPLILHTIENAKQAGHCLLSDVVVVTGDAEIFNLVKAAGHSAWLSRENHPNGTSRIAEFAEEVKARASFYINIQGDEPEISALTLSAMTHAFQQYPLVTLVTPLRTMEEWWCPSNVKAIVTRNIDDRRVLLFTREDIYSDTDLAGIPDCLGPETILRHIGVYGYTATMLAWYRGTHATPLEIAEELEQLRFVEHSFQFRAISAPPTKAINTQADYDDFVKRWRSKHGS